MKVAVNIVKTIFCLGIIAVAVYIFVAGIFMASGGGGIKGDPIIEIGNAGKEPVSLFNLDDYSDRVSSAVEGYDLSNEADVKDAIIDLYRVACETWYKVPARGGRYLGNGTGGVVGTIEGKLKVYNERFYVKGDPEEEGEYPYFGFEEKHTYAYDVNNAMLATTAENMLGSARRFVYMPSGDWSWEAVKNSSKMNTDGADANFTANAPVYATAAKVKEEKEEEQLAAHLGTGSAYYNYYGEIPDKSTYVLSSSAAIISANGVTPSLKQSTVDGKTVWTAEFAVDCDPKKDYTKYAAHAIGKTVSSAKEIIYKNLTVKFEVWETGYFRSWSATERWEGKSTFGTGFAEVASTELYTYDIKEVTDFILKKADIVLKADTAKPNLKTVVSVKYNGEEVFK